MRYQSAYETLHALMDTAFSLMASPALFDRVIAGLQDEHDIKMLCNLMLTKLIVLDPDETIRRLDSIAERFQAVLGVKLKENAVRQEVEKAQQANKDVLKVTVRLQALFQSKAGLEGGQHAVWKSYWEHVGKEFKATLVAAEGAVKEEK